MKKKRFASYLLAGKAATLPFAINNAQADAIPTYADVVTSKVSLIEQPATGVKLLTVAGSSSSSTYGGSYSGGDAAVCSTSMPSVMNVVLTGVKQSDVIYLAASADKDASVHLAVDNRIRVGSTNLTVITAFRMGGTALPGDDGSLAQATSSVSIPVNLTKLKNSGMFSGGKFYLQAFLFPTLDGANIWAQARVSELDEIAVSTVGCSSTYGSSTYGSTYGSTY
ncbi:MAG: hypothetical protein KGZ83_10720 [Sulfuricella sp.]|nr:hypothetical protein [Sulfuricella sp.]